MESQIELEVVDSEYYKVFYPYLKNKFDVLLEQNLKFDPYEDSDSDSETSSVESDSEEELDWSDPVDSSSNVAHDTTGVQVTMEVAKELSRKMDLLKKSLKVDFTDENHFDYFKRFLEDEEPEGTENIRQEVIDNDRLLRLLRAISSVKKTMYEDFYDMIIKVTTEKMESLGLSSLARTFNHPVYKNPEESEYGDSDFEESSDSESD
ncbi:hypothetical protein [Carp edema virus]|nr:hypothetical protein [Carp edema virus]